MPPPATDRPADAAPASARRRLCARCARPQVACVCAWASPVDNLTPVCVLQHPGEASQAKGTVTLLRLSLARCQVHVGELFEPAALGLGTLAHWALLYPGPGLRVADTAPPDPPAVQGLLVLDGTWRKTQRMLSRNPWLAGLPRVSLAQVAPSAYRIRRARQAHQLSTLEATCLALGRIEAAPQRYTAVLRGLDGFVAAMARRMPQRTALTEPEPATDFFTCAGLPE